MTSTSKSMSKLHWNLRRKGYSYKKAFSLTQKAKGIKWKFRPKHAYKDYDKDGVINKFDCRPLNKYRQDELDDMFKGKISLDEAKKKWEKKNPKKDFYSDGIGYDYE